MLRVVLASVIILATITVSSAIPTVAELKVDRSLCGDSTMEEFYVFENGQWEKKRELFDWWLCIDVNAISSDYFSAAKKAIELQNLGRESPYYGGGWIDADRGLVFVVVTDERAARSYAGKNVVVVKGKYSYSQLSRWKDAIFDEMRKDTFLGRYLSMTGPEETRNKVFIGVTKINDTILDRIKTLAERLDIPLDAIMVEKTGYFVPDILNAENATITISEVKFSRTDKIRPLVGGIKIQTSEVCTLGFVAERNGVRGFVTAGHCGNVNNAVFQPEFTGDSRDTFVGRVVADPRGPRYSDSLFVEILLGTSDFRVFNELNPYNNYPVFSEMQTQSRGMYVCKGGITTGETCGRIERVNFNITGQWPEYGTLYAQILATYARGSGDSGGPVYYDPLDTWIRTWCVNRYGVKCVDIYGIHVGAVFNNSRMYAVYSPISGIERDLGNLRTS